MNASAIRETIALAERISSPDLNAHSRKVELVQAQINHTEGLLEGLLGVEAEASRTLTSHLHDVQNHHRTLAEKGEQLQKLNRICSVYQHLSLEPLTWRDAQGFPRLVVFSLTSSTCRLVAMPGNDFKIEPDLPRNIAKQYKDVLQLLAAKRPARKGLELICQFKGLIPCEVREKIKKARELFGDMIFIIAEPGSFTLNEVTPLPKGDPLIVGYDSSADPDGLWLIADFDITSVEEAMTFHVENSQN
ncbi:MAG: hypothetical protein WC648_00760 [Candidatus Paceibacterota bacterium]|jgi:hypothetical protein